jgi:hypothetical protein
VLAAHENVGPIAHIGNPTSSTPVLISLPQFLLAQPPSANRPILAHLGDSSRCSAAAPHPRPSTRRRGPVPAGRPYTSSSSHLVLAQAQLPRLSAIPDERRRDGRRPRGPMSFHPRAAPVPAGRGRSRPVIPARLPMRRRGHLRLRPAPNSHTIRILPICSIVSVLPKPNRKNRYRNPSVSRFF